MDVANTEMGMYHWHDGHRDRDNDGWLPPVRKERHFNLTAADRKNLYPLDFDVKGLPMIGGVGKERSAIITKRGIEYYQVVCGHLQLHDAEGTAAGLTRIKEEKRLIHAGLKIEDIRVSFTSKVAFISIQIKSFTSVPNKNFIFSESEPPILTATEAFFINYQRIILFLQT